jgi:hypothetical protein
MIMRNADMRILDRNAVVGQPIGLLVIVFVAGLITTVLCLAIPTLLREFQIQSVEIELDKVLTEVTTMFEYADNGSLRTVSVVFPSSMRFVVFGDVPRNGTNEPANLTIVENTSNNYYYVMDDGTIRTFHSNARFSNHNMTQILLFHSGSYGITLRLCQKEGKTYLTMQ